jgi:hypothetical protein
MTMRPLFLLPLLLLAGCGGSEKIAPVSGRVTLNGQPLVNAAVVFQPIATEGNLDPGAGSGGRTDSDGRYTLTLAGKTRNGATVGKHKVRITLITETDSADDRPTRVKQLPAQFNRATKLEYEVPAGGTSTADFPLTVP